MGRIEIQPGLSIDESELSFTFACSPGPGGQNVNKVATKAILRFDVAASRSLNDAQKSMIFRKLRSRINVDGTLRVVCWRHRTQVANRREATERFQALVAEAMHVPKRRRETKPSRGSIERRLGEKRRRSEIKRQRRGPGSRGQD
ncbi:MAG: aminoacyl-tRNA hydrolase [Phycisphaerales bacterium]|nr:aminoacyl-tRNA hydrolase [Phycisphaerales bacterium]MCB9856227.1 aminoacyl-tRNA hydrolase [Phycisphaerales bacterium]MCB9863334.1 aminoacyl-tRNA hydrolase [Phycisphaerales bacterium]